MINTSSRAKFKFGNFIALSYIVLLALSLLLFAKFAQAQDTAVQIGTVALSKGSVWARSTGDVRRELSQGSEIYLGDIIETAGRSFAAILFSDSGKLTVQPNSEIELQEYQAASGQESQVINLIRGALRAVTGDIGKRRPSAVEYRGRNTTVGIRGTTLAMRLCTQGAALCTFKRGITFAGNIEANEPQTGEVSISALSTLDKSRRTLSKQAYQEILGDTFVWVLQGKIRVSVPEYLIDLEVAEEDFLRPPPNPSPSGFPPPGNSKNAGKPKPPESKKSPLPPHPDQNRRK
jgi:hypothetical protein